MADKLPEIYSYQVPRYMVPYLVNGDPGDMDDIEIEEADEFARKVQKEHGNALFIVANDGEEFMGMPDVGGLLFNTCMELIIIES